MNNYDNISLSAQPENLKVNLFKHQLASIYQMETMEREKVVHYDNRDKETKIGFNADTTGYGKTLSMIGLIARDKMEWDLDIPFVKEIINQESAGLILSRRVERYDKLPTTLILVPTSIVSQWEKELNMKPTTLRGRLARGWSMEQAMKPLGNTPLPAEENQ